MTVFLLVLSIAILGALIYLIYTLKSGKDEGPSLQQQQMLMEFQSRMSQEIQNIRKEITDTTGRSREEIQNRLDNIHK